MVLSLRHRQEINRQEINSYLGLGLIVSILIHLSLVITLSLQRSVPVTEPIVVSIITPKQLQQSRKNKGTAAQAAALAKTQIIAEPQSQPSTKVPENTRHLAEQNYQVEREQIKRGDGLDAGAYVGPVQPSAQSGPVAQEISKVTEQKPDQKKIAAQKESKDSKVTENSAFATKSELRELKLDEETLRAKFSKDSAKDNSQRSEQALDPALDITNYKAFSRPSGTGARFLGATGSADYLPHLPDGDITLLNAKANRFAVFVRRVATQVFGNLRSGGWDLLRAEDLFSINKFSVIHAVLSPKGELLHVRIEDPSGSARFDDVVVTAVKRGAQDPNPPIEAAAADGNIHFIFQARSWAAMSPGSRGGMGEKRWLLLGTGLG